MGVHCTEVDYQRALSKCGHWQMALAFAWRGYTVEAGTIRRAFAGRTGDMNARVYWDRQAPRYASGEGERRYRRFLDLYEANCWRFIEPLLPKPGQGLVLEAGCGTGRWVMRLAPLGHRMVLSDLSPQMIEHARRQVEQRGLAGQVEVCLVLDICDVHPLRTASFDLVLALGGPLSLCGDPPRAIAELGRVTRPGGHVVCGAANRWRTALEMTREGEMAALMTLLDTGLFHRPDGLIDHRFDPRELVELFEAHEMELLHLAALCPFSSFLPSEAEAGTLDDAKAYETMLQVAERYAEDPAVIALTGRLLAAARKRGDASSPTLPTGGQQGIAGQ